MSNTAAARRAPNILILLSDEQRWDALGVAGNAAARTPRLDTLAERSAVFTRCYTAYPLCCPARASLWTGLMPHRHHVFGNWRALRPDLRDGGLVAPFARAGYHTIYCGKWHVPGTTPARFSIADASAIPAVLDGRDRGRFIPGYRAYAAALGYDLLPGNIENLTPSDVAQLQRPGQAPCGAAAIPLDHFLEPWQTGQFLAALARRPTDRPFFAVCSYNAPHFPMIVPPPYDRLINPEDDLLPPNFRQGLDGKADEVRRSHYHTDLAGIEESEWRRLIAHYHGLCALVDAQVGRVLDSLQTAGELEHTIVVFASDHGDMLGSHSLNQKGFPLHYEETLRVPLLVAHPDAPHGRTVPGFFSLVDLLPTLAALAGVPLEDDIDGHALPNLLAGDTDRRPFVTAESYLLGDEDSTNGDGHGGGHGDYVPPESLNWGRDRINLSLRTATHRYIFRSADREELYDLATDPYENVNVAASAANAPLVADCRRTLAASLGRAFPEVTARLTSEGVKAAR